MDAFLLGVSVGGVVGGVLVAAFVALDYTIFCMDNFGPGTEV